MSRTKLWLGLALVGLAACAGDGGFQSEADDEAVDPSDPPTAPDPDDAAELLPPDVDLPLDAIPDEVPSDAELAAIKAACPQRARELGPAGLTFAIHISKKADEGWAAYRQLRRVRDHVRARDVFVIERDAPWVRALRQSFPCNEFHYIAYPDELADAYAAAPVIDGIIVDWEGGAVNANGAAYSIDKLGGYADKIRGKGLRPSVAPSWPQGYNDAGIVKASGMKWDLAQIQGTCAAGGPRRFAALARSLVKNFIHTGLSARDLGVEISLDSFAFADNHTGLDRSVACTRKAYGKGARAIYIYGNGQPHLEPYFKALANIGVRN